MSTMFIDESKSKDYLLVATTIATEDIARIRKGVSGLRLPGQRRVHFTSESHSRRRSLLSALERLGLTARVYACDGGRSERDAREACLSAVVADAVAMGAGRIVLERDVSIERWDRQLLFRELARHGAHGVTSYTHESAASEPLLWIPDAIAWSHARGGEWARRVKPLIAGMRWVG